MLTQRQQDIFEFIVRHIAQHGLPPTRDEIASAFGFRSPYAAECHIRALEQKGAIERLPGKSRGLRPSASALADFERRQSAATKTPPDMQQRGAETPRFDTRAANTLWTVPLIGRVAAGAPILAAPHVEQELRVDPGWFRKQPDYLLRVRGDSMRDAGILDGDLLAVQHSRDARNGDIVVARLDDDVTVKRFEQRRGLILLHPENPAYTPIEVRPGRGDFAIEGRAIGVVRDWS